MGMSVVLRFRLARRDHVLITQSKRRIAVCAVMFFVTGRTAYVRRATSPHRASKNASNGTLVLFAVCLIAYLSITWKRMRSGDRPGLQNRWVAGFPVTGGF